MTREQAAAFAQTWVRNWNARDIDAVVSHFAPDARFVSPVAARRTGHPLVTGRAALTAYWQAAKSFSTFEFTLERAIFDEARQELAIIYTRDVEGRCDRACEILHFEASGLVIEGEAMYGAERF